MSAEPMLDRVRARWRKQGRLGSGAERANRVIVALLGLQRLSYLPPVALSLGADGYRGGGLNTALVLVTVSWNVLLFGQVWRRGWFTPAAVWVDVGWAAALLVLVTGNASDESLNWSERMAQAAAALAGAALAPVGVAGLAVGLLLVAHTVGTLGAGGGLAELVSCLNGILWFAVIVGFVLRYLRRQGRRLDESTRLLVDAETRRARSAARLAHFRALHDTVLTTLVAIARGGLDHRTEQVRLRCAREADYVRRLCREDAEAGPADLGRKLTEVITGAEALGLRVAYQRDALPADLPPDVVDGLGEAAREALNNVIKHAGTDRTWVTALRSGPGVTVRVVDRGRGFDPARRTPGFGLPFSVIHRMSEIGGATVIDSAPGEGTSVELAWPAAGP